MIRINLAPPVVRSRRARAARVALAFGVAYVGVLGGLGGWYAALVRAEAQMAQEVTILSHELETLGAMLGRGEPVRDALADLTRRARAIQALTRGQATAIRILDAVLDALPRDLWLTSLEGRGLDVRVTGSAVSARAVADFTSNLRTSGFAEVEIVLSRQDLGTRPPSPLGFEVTCRLAP